MSEILDWGESNGLTLRKTADEAGVPLSTLRYWQKRAQLECGSRLHWVD
jgi:hypothetical protein